MPLTSAERVRRFREKLKKDPEKFKEHKKKHAALVKSKSKKIADLSEAEKEKQREKWRNQKRRQKQNKQSSSASCAPSLHSSEPSTIIIPLKKKRRNSTALAKKYKRALKRIKVLTTSLQTTKKKLYRLKKKYETCEELVNKMKIREEVLESSLKQSLKQCKTHNEKRITKRIIENETVIRTRKKTYITKLLGLKGKIRKSKEIIKDHKIQSEIESFYLRDDISRCTAGKRECRTEKGSKRKEQIRYLTDTLTELHKIYKNEGGKYSLSTFYKYKPFFVLSPGIQNRETCLCIKHANFQFLLVALHKRKLLLDCKTVKDILTQTTCKLNSYKCMNGECASCKLLKLEYHLVDDQAYLTVKWMQWERLDHTYNKIENGVDKSVVTKKWSKTLKEGTIGDLIKSLEYSIPEFKKHYYTWKNQQLKYHECINSLNENEALILCDFSENYTSKLTEEIQSMHFGASKQQITLHTGMVFWKNQSQSFCSVADNNCHEPAAIWAHLLPVLKMLKTLKPKTKIIHFFSDSPSSQYRQKKNFYLHNLFMSKLGFYYSTWSFTESGHGKGVADGIGGSVKRALDRHISYGNDITNGTEAHEALTKLMKSVKCFYIQSTDIENINTMIPKTLKTIVGTMRIHQIISIRQGEIGHRSHSCFCGPSKGLCDCFAPQNHNFTKSVPLNVHLNKITHTADIHNTETRTTADISPPTTDTHTTATITPPKVIATTSPLTADIHTTDLRSPSKSNSLINVTTSPPKTGTRTTTTITSTKDETHSADTNLSEMYLYNNFNKIIELFDENFSEAHEVNECFSTPTRYVDNLESIDVAENLTLFPFPEIELINLPNSGTDSVPKINPQNIEFYDQKLSKKRTSPEIVQSKKRKLTELNQNNLELKCRDRTGPPIACRAVKENTQRRISKALKTTVTRTVQCATCKKHVSPFRINLAKCMVCNKSFCSECSSGYTHFDYICNKCLDGD